MSRFTPPSIVRGTTGTPDAAGPGTGKDRRFAPRTVMEILGHSQIAVTMNVFTQVSHDDRREAMGHMDRLLKRRQPTA